MSTPNTPQGSPLEQAAKNNSLAAKVTFITLAHIAVIGGGLVFYGCSKTPPETTQTDTAANTNTLSSAMSPSTDAVVPAPLTDTNSIVAPVLAGTGVQPAPTAPGLTPAPSGLAPLPTVSPEPIATTPSPAPVPAPSPAPAPAGDASEYQVQKGDIGASIAKKHGISIAQLKSANPSVNWNKLKVGQPIQIPAGSAQASGTGAGAPTTATAPAPAPAPAETGVVHLVKANDTLSSISRKYGVSWKQIRTANNLKSENIKIGDKLKIPAKTTKTKTAAADTGNTQPNNNPEPSAIPLPSGRQP